MVKLIVLDRDGVINEDSDHYIKSADEWKAIPGSLQAIARLNRAGYKVVVATNQSGISRGMFDLETMAMMHNKMYKLAAQVGAHIDAVFFCPHGPDANCHCRKPMPGLLLQIAARYNVNMHGVPMVGDSLRDLQAGYSQGCKCYLVRTGKGEETLTKHGKFIPEGTEIFDNLAALAKYLVPDDPHQSGDRNA